MKIGLIREGKLPPDERVALIPEQCVELKERWPEVELVVQESEVRRIPDEEYIAAGVEVVKDVSDCDILIGVKEVNVEDLIEGKTYLFFSHTFKKQPYNAKLLAAILKKKVSLIDYETLNKPDGNRIIGFGRWAGIVGAYNGIRAWGIREKSFNLPRAIDGKDLQEMIEAAKAIDLPGGVKIVLTGFGRVGRGAAELLDAIGIRKVEKDAFLQDKFPEEAVYTQINMDDYNERKDGGDFDIPEFINDPSPFQSSFLPYACAADIFIAGHFYSQGSPYIITREDFRHPQMKLKVVADVSCDIDGPVACTLRPSSVSDPVYGYDPVNECECSTDTPGSITVMAIDNLPCELPRDASKGFGRDLLDHVIPLLIEGDKDGILAGARETNLDGELCEKYQYLQEYVAGV
jgi:saccharopine dehydrogenase (NAD+, L-lysine-forming)